MSEVVFRHVSKSFGSTRALDGFDITLQSGELVCLLGPSGCGKTTALRILAGFETPDSGDVEVDGRSVLDVRPRDRRFGIVFQSYSLFPNMSARKNIGFALGLRGVSGEPQRRRVDELLEMTGLAGHADKYPHQLSGGQQQRVALARALATEPPVLLLDEPLSALDAAVRDQLRVEIRKLQRSVGITTLFVTHDQHEAMAIADRIAVMEHGSIVQLGPPAEVYTRPRTAFVSAFLGTSNRLPVVRRDGASLVLGCRVDGLAAGTAEVFVRPEHVRLTGGEPAGGEPGASARIQDLSFFGALTRVECRTDDGSTVVVDVASRDIGDLVVGGRVALTLDGPTIDVVGSDA
jgi:putative spermidine/putrescine transport system ATP-binding protein